MLREFRLRHAADFRRLRHEGRSYPHRLMVMSVAPNTLSRNRYGFIVSKHLGKAVQRNRVRRRMREVVRLLHPQLQPGYDVVMIARLPLVEQPFDVVQRTVSELFRQAGILEG
jgi:ribonuclease P protein component